MWLKIRDEGTVKNKAVYLALGIDATGRKGVLGLWIEHTERVKFWLKVFNDLKHRGVADILIAVVDGLKGWNSARSLPSTMLIADWVVVDALRSIINASKQRSRIR